MHRSSITTGRALAGSLMAASLLVLGACAERDDDAPGDDVITAEEAATAPATPAPTQTSPVQTPPGQMPPGQADPGQMTDADREFLGMAIASNQHELEAARLGVERAGNAEVKAFAERMQADHTQLGERMQPLASQAGVSTAPAEAPMPNLENASGADFDRAFMDMMVADHERAVADFERAANDTTHSAQVRAAAQEALPTLRAHLQDAQTLRQQVGGGADS